MTDRPDGGNPPDEPVDADLPGDAGPPAEPPPRSHQAPQPPQGTSDDPLHGVDEAIERWKESAEAAQAARREASVAAFEDEMDAIESKLRESRPPEDPAADDLGDLDLPRQFVRDPPGHQPGPGDVGPLPPGQELPDHTQPAVDTRIRRATTDRIDRSKLFRFRLPIIIGGFGVVGLVLLGVMTFSGSDDPSTTSAAPSTTVAGASTTSRTTTTTTVAAIDPASRLLITGTDALVDTDGGLWVVLTFETPWEAAPPEIDFAYAVLLAAGVVTDDGIHSSLWSVTDGVSYAEGMSGASALPRTTTDEPIVRTSLWITPDGRLAMKIPGSNGAAGLDAAGVSTDSNLILVSRSWTSADDEGTDNDRTIALGPITDGGALPLPNWIEIDPDTEPIVLEIPNA